jgi:preprotein translocase subunit YajC
LGDPPTSIPYGVWRPDPPAGTAGSLEDRMIQLLAQNAPAQEVPWFLENPIFLIVGMVLIWWLLVLKPQRKQEKARGAKLEAIKKGDKVLTRAGIFGVVSRVKDDVVILRIDTDGKVLVPFQKAAIEDVLTGDGSDAS